MVNPFVAPALVLIAVALGVGFALGHVTIEPDPLSELAIYLAVIGIGLTGAVYLLQTHQQGEIVGIIGRMDTRDERETTDKDERKDFYEKGLVYALGEIRVLSYEIPVLIAKNDIKAIQEKWKKFRAPSDRLSSLYIVSANIVDHDLLDYVDLIRGTISEQIDDTIELQTIASQLSYVEIIINKIFHEKLNTKRIEVYQYESKIVDEAVARMKKETKLSQPVIDEFEQNRKNRFKSRFLYAEEYDNM